MATQPPLTAQQKRNASTGAVASQIPAMAPALVGVLGAATIPQVVAIAQILASGLGQAAIAGLLLSALLGFGISRDAAVLAIKIAGREPAVTGGASGVASEDIASERFIYRAAYILAASERLMRSLSSTRGPEGRVNHLKLALRAEWRYWRQHLEAQRHRLHAARETDAAARSWGDLLGWYLGPRMTHTPACIAAAGHNFRLSHRPRVGWPGTVHAGCGCYAGPPFASVESVDQATRGIRGD